MLDNYNGIDLSRGPSLGKIKDFLRNMFPRGGREDMAGTPMERLGPRDNSDSPPSQGGTNYVGRIGEAKTDFIRRVDRLKTLYASIIFVICVIVFIFLSLWVTGKVTVTYNG